MGFLQDNLIPIFKKRELTFKESYKESDNVHTFVFEKEKDITWKAGQYGLFGITHKKIKNATKPFSLASAPSENVIKISTIIREKPSEFKKALLELQQGMKVNMSGPLGPFYLKDNSRTLLIAGGIGITPFRSILKQVEAEGTEVGNRIHLLYLDSQKSHLFKNEIDGIADNTSMSITYLDSSDELHSELDKFIALNKDNGKYYVAGPKAMVGSITTYLQNKKVSKRNITKDSFFGYS
ncbi:FAD-dependent oxidoreductase [Cohnella thailandensis]|uniref:FAD-dependent oxidoreductase n=1 Tax=Cohnella thailandensis TaxID=557557 RepID=A0A841T426_9BACL|nr:FAD-dependent oxidoreductase [Cohnella thailandensis]MBP1973000.1 ferredoxin-NADP reductase [Cohnella thailandensis]